MTAISPAALHLAVLMIREFEGCKYSPYWDPNGRCWSIAYGFCALADGTTVTQHTPPMTQTECDEQLDAKLTADYMPGVLRSLGAFVPADNVLAALTSFAWNEGVGRIASAGLPPLIKVGKLQAAGAKMRQYDVAGGKVLPGLVTRRAKESAVLCGASWPVTAPAVHAAPVAAPASSAEDDAALYAKYDPGM